MPTRMQLRRAPAPAARAQKPAALRPGARPGGGVRHTKPVKRRSAGITPVRAAAALALLVGLGGLYGAVSSGVFAAERLVLNGNTWTTDEVLLAALNVPDGKNVFTVRTGELADRLAALPAIRGASVSVALPNEIRVDVAERKALVVWLVGDRRFLVDEDGLLFAELLATDQATTDAAALLPVIDDRRVGSEGLVAGSTLDPISLDAALRLGAVRPVDVGSAGTGLHIRVDDKNGFTVRGDPLDWSAIFGFYTPTLRPTDLIPGQVRLLRSFMLKNGESNLLRIILADDRSGTWVPRSGPTPSKSPKP